MEKLKNTDSGFINTLLNKGYSSCEICFNVKFKRKGIYKWMEDKKIIKPKTEGFCLMIRDFNRVDILSSAESHGGIIEIISTKINGIH